MSNADPPPNVKIYDRPEPKTPKLLFLVIAVIVLLAIGLLVYKFVLHPATPTANAHAVRSGRAMAMRTYEYDANSTGYIYDNCAIKRYFGRV